MAKIPLALGCLLASLHLGAMSEDVAFKRLPDGGDITVLGGSLFKIELFNLKMLAHRSKKFTGKERVVAYPFENELCKGETIRHIQHDVLYELSSTSFIPIETSHSSIYHQSGFKEIKDYVAQQLSPNAPIIYYILGTFTSCDRVSRKELDDRFRISFGGGSGFSLGGFYDQRSNSLNRYCLSLRMNTELHPKLLENGYIPPNSRTEMCVYSDDYKEGENTNISAAGLVYDKGNYFVRGAPENRVKEILIKGAMISLLSNFIGVPDVSMLPFLQNDYIEYEIDSFTRKFRNETPAFQWNMLQAALNLRYGANISYREYGRVSDTTAAYLDKIAPGLSQSSPLEIYEKLIYPLFFENVGSQIKAYNNVEQEAGKRDFDANDGWQVNLQQSKCRGRRCTLKVTGMVNSGFIALVKGAMLKAYTGSANRSNVQCKWSDSGKLTCNIRDRGSDRVVIDQFKQMLAEDITALNPAGLAQNR